MNKRTFNPQSGISLIEVIVVLVIIGVVVAFAVAQFGEAADVFQTQNIARELKVNLERARFDSVKRRPESEADMARVVITSDTSFTVSLDSGQNGTIEDTETRTIDFSERGNAKIVGDNLSFPISMLFDRRGHVTVTNSLGLEIDPTFTICDGCESVETAETPTSYVVYVSPTGTVAMYDNSQTRDTFENPIVTTIDNGTDIEPLVSTAEGALDYTGITSDTGGEILTNPTLTPTAYPTATATLTPTPTPVEVQICAVNEIPDETGCECQSPMSVDHRGKCR